MTKTTIAGLAGTLLLSSAGLALAASGTTVVPAGQNANIEIVKTVPVAASSGDAASKGGDAASSAGNAAKDAGTGSQDTKTAKAESASSGNAGSRSASNDGGKTSGSTGSASGNGSSGTLDGPVDMANVDNPKPDDHPSKDTKDEGNKVASFKPNDADTDPGLALDSAEKPVYAFADGKTADWYAWRGYKKYGANCLQCHGPDGLGSSFAPNLTDELQNIDYYEFAGIIVSGQKNVWNPSGNSVMPAWGEDPNVMCSMNAIYTYLRGRADGVIGRGEPPRPPKTDKSEAAKDYEYSCLGF